MAVKLNEWLGIDHPIIMAPMFLVSDATMVKAALDAGITAAIPALNYRTDEELRAGIRNIQQHTSKPFGINLIVNRSNPKMKIQLNTCVELGVAFIITSLGNPKPVIDLCKPKGIKVFCDVTDLNYAQKVEAQGADAVIAVNNQAGGHAGNISPEELIRTLTQHLHIPVISAGGIATSSELHKHLSWGASGASIGTVFIASEEAPVTIEYKQALVDHGAADIVMTEKLSGTPCTVINTPYVQKAGTKQSSLERFLNRNKRFKKFFKMFTFLRGMKKLRKSAYSTTYKTVWCAGPSIEHIHSIRSVKEIVRDLTQ